MRHLLMLSHGVASAALSTRCTTETTPNAMSHGLFTAIPAPYRLAGPVPS